MLSPALKTKASIWSFDSGYGSGTLEDDEEFQIGHPESSTTYTALSLSLNLHDQSNNGKSSDLEAGDSVRLSAITSFTEPQVTELNVFTAKVRSSNESLALTQNDGIDCLRCQLLDIINPGENIRCEDCTSGDLETLGAVTGANELPRPTTVAPRLDLLIAHPPKESSQPESTGRCSTCKISAPIQPVQFVGCASYTSSAGLLSPTPSNQPTRVKRSCARRPPTKLESHATRLLQGWLREHRNNPYPDNKTKRSLAEECGITEKQVNTWFTNARARKRIVDANSSDPASDDEGSRQTRLSSVTSTAMSYRDASLGFEAQSDHRFSDASYSAGGVSNHINAATSRRGKKKDYGQSGNTPSLVNQALSTPHPSTAASDNNTDSESQTWQCTFCYRNIARKSWRRHEETQHRPKRKWTCLLTGPSLTIPSRSDNSTLCVFCMVPNPSDNHFAECHRIAECMAKNEHERTFLRPDHLRQHVKNFHKAKLDGTIRDLWRREGSGSDAVSNWVCGFCAKVLKTWDDRETHIAGHFKNGLSMADWKGNARPHAEVEASNKRPTSSEGRPNMLTKLARTLTGRSTRDQHAWEAHEQVADTIDATYTSTHTPGLDAPLLPELVFEDFMPGLGDAYYDFDETSLAGVYEQDFASAERHDSAFLDGNDTTLEFGSLTEEFVDHEFSNGNAFGLW